MRIAIVGTGLMGASVALAARRRGDDVVGWDADPDALAAAVARGAVQAASSVEDAVADVELAVVAAPIEEATRKGLLEPDPSMLRPTPLGRRFLNDLQSLFLAERGGRE